MLHASRTWSTRRTRGIEALLLINERAVHDKQVRFPHVAFITQVGRGVGETVRWSTDGTRKRLYEQSVGSHKIVLALARLPGETPVGRCATDVMSKATTVRGLRSSNMLRAVKGHVAVKVIVPHT